MNFKAIKVSAVDIRIIGCTNKKMSTFNRRWIGKSEKEERSGKIGSTRVTVIA